MERLCVRHNFSLWFFSISHSVQFVRQCVHVIIYKFWLLCCSDISTVTEVLHTSAHGTAAFGHPPSCVIELWQRHLFTRTHIMKQDKYAVLHKEYHLKLFFNVSSATTAAYIEEVDQQIVNTVARSLSRLSSVQQQSLDCFTHSVLRLFFFFDYNEKHKERGSLCLSDAVWEHRGHAHKVNSHPRSATNTRYGFTWLNVVLESAYAGGPRRFFKKEFWAITRIFLAVYMASENGFTHYPT